MARDRKTKVQADMSAKDDSVKPVTAEDSVEPELAGVPAAEAVVAPEPEAVVEPEPEAVDEVPPEAPPQRSRGWMVAVALVLIGGLGFAAAWFDVLKLRGDDPVPGLQAQVAGLTDQVAKAESDRAALSARIAAAEARTNPEAVAALETRVAAAEAALTALAEAPAGDGTVTTANFAALAAAVAALKADVGAMAGAPVDDAAVRAAVDQAMVDWTAAQAADAEAAVDAARIKAGQVDAAQRIRAAAMTGAPYAEALSALDGIAVDELLRQRAEAGLPTLAALTESFPDVARAALDAARRAEVGTGLGDRLANFLDVQTGARSLEPREGDDPDAVLSRAEAAVQAGDVGMALTELSGLPDVGRAEMADWMARAEEYQAADAALSALSAAVGL